MTCTYTKQFGRPYWYKPNEGLYYCEPGDFVEDKCSNDGVVYKYVGKTRSNPSYYELETKDGKQRMVFGAESYQFKKSTKQFSSSLVTHGDIMQELEKLKDQQSSTPIGFSTSKCVYGKVKQFATSDDTTLEKFRGVCREIAHACGYSKAQCNGFAMAFGSRNKAVSILYEGYSSSAGIMVAVTVTKKGQSPKLYSGLSLDYSRNTINDIIGE